MGLNTNVIKLLLQLDKEGLRYGDVLTLGRQRLNLPKRTLHKHLREFGYPVSGAKIKAESRGYCEGFLKLLGASEVHSMDVSDYEKASLLHDLNQPIGESLHCTYDTLIDSGTLEHVFNFPVAIKNCMELLKIGGYYIGFTPCNNFFGHGFYQFSPELYYRVFSAENGFVLSKMYFYVDKPNAVFYEVKDPAAVRERVILNNAYPSFLMVLAQKEARKNIFEATPQQSDYEHIVWKKEKSVRRLQKLVPKPLRKMPRPLKKVMEGWAVLRRDTGTADKRFFKKVVQK